MSCKITNGRPRGCKDGISGLKSVYIVNYGDLGEITYGLNGEVTDIAGIGGSFSVYKYDLNNNSSNELIQKFAGDSTNGTNLYTQDLNFILLKLNKESDTAMTLLGSGTPHIIVEKNDGQAIIVGIRNGCDLQGGSNISISGDKSGLSGYTYNFSTQEREPANYLEGAVEGDPLAGITSATYTIVTE